MADTPAGSDLALRLPSPVVPLRDERLDRTGVRVLLKRDDLIHAELPGNKWRKLRHNLSAARDQGHDTLLTFGGAYSNHIRATAAAGHYFGLRTIGVIRGEEHVPLNPSLAYAVGRGMRLTYLDRTTYRNKHDAAVVAELRRRWGRFYLLPEGGSNALAVRGCTELPAEIVEEFEVICCAVGTGGTLAGIAAGLRPGQRAIGVSALKGGQFLAEQVRQLQREAVGAATTNWHLEYGYHCGGFARSTPQLAAFARDFAARHGLEPEGVYVAKLLLGLYDMVERGSFDAGTTIVAVVTG